MFIVRFFIYFALSFLVLSIPFKGKTVFGHLHRKASPVTEEVLGRVGEKVVQAIEAGLDFGKKLFKNSTPLNSSFEPTQQKSQVTKPVQAKSRTVKKTVNELGKDPEDNYTYEERRLLKKILNENL